MIGYADNLSKRIQEYSIEKTMRYNSIKKTMRYIPNLVIIKNWI